MEHVSRFSPVGSLRIIPGAHRELHITDHKTYLLASFSPTHISLSNQYLILS